jgi:hypothetical protein
VLEAVGEGNSERLFRKDRPEKRKQEISVRHIKVFPFESRGRKRSEKLDESNCQ